MRYIICWVTLMGIALATGCAGSSKPVIDPAGVDMEQYNVDLAECEQISEQVDQKVVEGAAGGAVVGGLIGAITGNTAKGAGVGAVAGGAKGVGSTNKEKSRVVKNCLRNRGYQILN
ncbi:MAG: glycine zipper family protein [Gammaproteobacteria bacterium]